MIAFLKNQAVLRGAAAACFIIGTKIINSVIFEKSDKRRAALQKEIDETFNQMLQETQEQINKEAEDKFNEIVDSGIEQIDSDLQDFMEKTHYDSEKRLHNARAIFELHERYLEKFKKENPELFSEIFKQE